MIISPFPKQHVTNLYDFRTSSRLDNIIRCWFKLWYFDLSSFIYLDLVKRRFWYYWLNCIIDIIDNIE